MPAAENDLRNPSLHMTPFGVAQNLSSGGSFRHGSHFFLRNAVRTKMHRMATTVKSEIEKYPFLLNLARMMHYQNPGSTLADLRQELVRRRKY